MVGNQNRLNSGVILRWTLLTVSGLLLAMLAFFEPLYGPVSSPIALAAPDGQAIFKQKCQGHAGYVFTGNLELAKKIGLRTRRRILFYNGAIECRLLRFEIYEGSKRPGKNPPADS